MNREKRITQARKNICTMIDNPIRLICTMIDNPIRLKVPNCCVGMNYRMQ